MVAGQIGLKSSRPLSQLGLSQLDQAEMTGPSWPNPTLLRPTLLRPTWPKPELTRIHVNKRYNKCVCELSSKVSVTCLTGAWSSILKSPL